MDADSKPLARLGFAIAAVSPLGELLGVAYGCPPSWILDSAGAETWAFYTVISTSPTVPRVVTDCLGIVNTLHDGRVRATSHTRVHARVWQMIESAMDADDSWHQAQRQVVWMPAHGSQATIDVKLKSDGSLVSSLDWRANRLVDAAAKAAVRAVRVGAAQRILYHRTTKAYEHALTELAVVTVAANNHLAHVVDADGNCKRQYRRDSSAIPRSKRPPRMSGSASQLSDPPPCLCRAGRAKRLASDFFADRNPDRARFSVETPAAKRRRLDHDNARIENERFMQTWRSARSKRCFRSVSAIPAAERLAALRARVSASSNDAPA